MDGRFLQQEFTLTDANDGKPTYGYAKDCLEKLKTRYSCGNSTIGKRLLKMGLVNRGVSEDSVSQILSRIRGGAGDAEFKYRNAIVSLYNWEFYGITPSVLDVPITQQISNLVGQNFSDVEKVDIFRPYIVFTRCQHNNKSINISKIELTTDIAGNKFVWTRSASSGSKMFMYRTAGHVIKNSDQSFVLMGTCKLIDSDIPTPPTVEIIYLNRRLPTHSHLGGMYIGSGTDGKVFASKIYLRVTDEQRYSQLNYLSSYSMESFTKENYIFDDVEWRHRILGIAKFLKNADADDSAVIDLRTF